jgi:predicted Zn-dependent protease with MMP-like domain
MDVEAVERVALAAVKEHGGDPDLWRYVSWARFEQGRLREALAAAERADDALYRAKAQFHLWAMEDAAHTLAGYEADDPEDAAEAEWYRGLLAEFGGGDGTEHYRRAAEIDPDAFRLPLRLDDDEVEDVVRAALAALPAPVREAVEEVAIEIRPLPRPYPDVDPLTLGLYVGRDRMQRTYEAGGPELPPRIEIYQSNVERLASDREDAIEELRITLLHEIAHHLGYDERGVEDLGLA